jgi:RNA polymerase sigma factor (sigma-70 family)
MTDHRNPESPAVDDLDGITEEHLVRRVLDGDRKAFETIVKRYQRLVYGFMLRKISDVGTAQDLAQEVFMLGYEHLSRLKDPERLKSWLMGIAANMVRDHYKRRKMLGLPDGLEIGLSGLDPLQSVEQRERHELLYVAMQKLPERYRAVLVKRYLEEREYADIAADLGLNVGAVEVCVHRARKALAQALREYMHEGEF